MGMSASQSRLLSLTTRLSDLELKAQNIQNQKIRLSEKSTAASKKYMDALSAQNLVFNAPDQVLAGSIQNITSSGLYRIADANGNYFYSPETDYVVDKTLTTENGNKITAKSDGTVSVRTANGGVEVDKNGSILTTSKGVSFASVPGQKPAYSDGYTTIDNTGISKVSSDGIYKYNTSGVLEKSLNNGMKYVYDSNNLQLKNGNDVVADYNAKTYKYAGVQYSINSSNNLVRTTYSDSNYSTVKDQYVYSSDSIVRTDKSVSPNVVYTYKDGFITKTTGSTVQTLREYPTVSYGGLDFFPGNGGLFGSTGYLNLNSSTEGWAFLLNVDKNNVLDLGLFSISKDATTGKYTITSELGTTKEIDLSSLTSETINLKTADSSIEGDNAIDLSISTNNDKNQLILSDGNLTYTTNGSSLKVQQLETKDVSSIANGAEVYDAGDFKITKNAPGVYTVTPNGATTGTAYTLSSMQTTSYLKTNDDKKVSISTNSAKDTLYVTCGTKTITVSASSLGATNTIFNGNIPKIETQTDGSLDAIVAGNHYDYNKDGSLTNWVNGNNTSINYYSSPSSVGLIFGDVGEIETDVNESEERTVDSLGSTMKLNANGVYEYTLNQAMGTPDIDYLISKNQTVATCNVLFNNKTVSSFNAGYTLANNNTITFSGLRAGQTLVKSGTTLSFGTYGTINLDGGVMTGAAAYNTSGTAISDDRINNYNGTIRLYRKYDSETGRTYIYSYLNDQDDVTENGKTTKTSNYAVTIMDKDGFYAVTNGTRTYEVVPDGSSTRAQNDLWSFDSNFLHYEVLPQYDTANGKVYVGGTMSNGTRQGGKTFIIPNNTIYGVTNEDDSEITFGSTGKVMSLPNDASMTLDTSNNLTMNFFDGSRVTPNGSTKTIRLADGATMTTGSNRVTFGDNAVAQDYSGYTTYMNSVGTVIYRDSEQNGSILDFTSTDAKTKVSCSADGKSASITENAHDSANAVKLSVSRNSSTGVVTVAETKGSSTKNYTITPNLAKGKTTITGPDNKSEELETVAAGTWMLCDPNDKNEFKKIANTDNMKSSKWLLEQLQCANLFIQKVDEDGNWADYSYVASSVFVTESDNSDVAKAEAEYEHTMAEIQTKDKRFDRDLESIQTEHTALETQRDEIKDIIDKHVDKSFKIFG